MNEIEQKDYEAARSYAESIKTIANNFMSTFDSIDSSMKTLYGEAWQSSGADVSNGRYQEMKKSYEIFYSKVQEMYATVMKITANYEEADAQAGSDFSNM